MTCWPHLLTAYIKDVAKSYILHLLKVSCNRFGGHIWGFELWFQDSVGSQKHWCLSHLHQHHMLYDCYIIFRVKYKFSFIVCLACMHEHDQHLRACLKWVGHENVFPTCIRLYTSHHYTVHIFVQTVWTQNAAKRPKKLDITILS